MKHKKTNLRIKDVLDTHGGGGHNEISYHTSGCFTHDDLMLFIRLHVTNQERSNDMSIVKYFMEHVCSGSVGRISIAEALIASGYKPIKHNDYMDEWRFRIRLRNVVRLYRNKNNSSIISYHQNLPDELTIDDVANGIIRKYRLTDDNPDRKDELMVLNERNVLIGLYSIVSETRYLDPPEPFKKKDFERMLRKWNDLALWKGRLVVGQWVRLKWWPPNSRGMIMSIDPEKTMAYNYNHELESQYVVYSRGTRRSQRYSNHIHVVDHEMTPCAYQPANKLLEFAYYCLYDALVDTPEQAQLPDIELARPSGPFRNLKANVMADTILLPRLQRALTDEEAVLAVRIELQRLMTEQVDYQRFGHICQSIVDRESGNPPYQAMTRQILNQFLADFEVAKPWLGIMYHKELHPDLEKIHSRDNLLFDPYFDEHKVILIIMDYLEQDRKLAKPVFYMESQWFAIYRVLYDLGIIGKSRKEFVQWINSYYFDYGPACRLDSLNKAPEYFRIKRYAEWANDVYSTSQSYQATFFRYYDVAQHFYHRFTENDMNNIIKE